MAPPEDEKTESNGEKKQKPPNLDIPKDTSGEEDGHSPKSGSGSIESQKSPRLEPNEKSPLLEPGTKTSRSDSSPKTELLDAEPHGAKATDSETETPPRSPRPPVTAADSPKKYPDSPSLRGDCSKQSQLQERFMERRGHHHESSHRSEHRHVSKSDSSVSHRRHSSESEDESSHHHHHHHHHHHRSPKRTMSERRRSQRASSSSHGTEHRRSSSAGGSNAAAGGSGSRRSSMRMSDKRKSSVHEHGTPGHRRMSRDSVSMSDGVKTNGSPVHIEYYKKPSHPSGPYMSPGLSPAYKTPAAEVLIASLIIIVGLVALITSWATGIKVWLVVGGVCVGLGAMFLLLGLCWYCALARQKEENENFQLKLLNAKQLLNPTRTPSNASENPPPQMV